MDEHTTTQGTGYTSPYPNPYAEGYNQQAGGYGNQNPWNSAAYGKSNAYGFSEPVSKPQAKNAFYYIFMVLVPMKMLATYISAGTMMLAIDPSHFLDGTFMDEAMALPSTPLDTVILTLRLLAFLFLMMDIRELNKVGHPVTAALLFGLFFRIGYFICRAKVTGSKKTPAVLYTLFLFLMFLGYSIWAMSGFYQALGTGAI